MGVEPTRIHLTMTAPEAENLRDWFMVFWPRRRDRIIRQMLRAVVGEIRRRDSWA